MKKAFQLKEERAAKFLEVQNLIQTAETEKRELTTEEQTKFDTISGEIEELDAQILRAEKREKITARAAANAAGSGSDTTVDSTIIGGGGER